MTSLSRNMDIELQNFQGLLKFIEKSEARLVDNLVHFIDLGISTREIEVEMKEARKQRKWLLSKIDSLENRSVESEPSGGENEIDESSLEDIPCIPLDYDPEDSRFDIIPLWHQYLDPEDW